MANSKKSFLERLVKAIKNPRLVIPWIVTKTTIGFNYARVLIYKSMGSMRLVLGRNIAFYQRTYITGLGSIKIGDKCIFGVPSGGGFRSSDCEIQARYENSKIFLGRNIASNNGLVIIATDSITIGDDCLFGRNLQISDCDGHGLEPAKRRLCRGLSSPVVIGKNVWFGNNVTVLKGTIIGDNCVVGAGSILTGKHFPPNVIIAGNPAKIIKELPVNDTFQ
ncbi:DapH/DapD/GlmU-related protein [Dethiosulfovibrio salsuginis]|uniref:Maltose O-acetyltransferase n=1 Tax=Dethiosulfovibrio salsuginis TaxID=561720 RepID=A0A1X7LF36_9BACT|nr:DapH/DapD/GlmU-related protein [Dethiosulfovibrio salsuginis]SMG51789.1 maltose O-acetyltransferase [Dethiosulfovibrio salsuginis]